MQASENKKIKKNTGRADGTGTGTHLRSGEYMKSGHSKLLPREERPAINMALSTTAHLLAGFLVDAPLRWCLVVGLVENLIHSSLVGGIWELFLSPHLRRRLQTPESRPCECCCRDNVHHACLSVLCFLQPDGLYDRIP